MPNGAFRLNLITRADVEFFCRLDRRSAAEGEDFRFIFEFCDAIYGIRMLQ
jgi:hypothetical protein